MTARRLNKVLLAILVPMTILAFLSAGAAVWMWDHPGAVMAVRQAIETYPPTIRRAFRAEFRASRGEVVADVVRIDQARTRLVELLRAETLDEDAIRAAMAEMRNSVSDLQELGQERLLDVMREIDPAERAKIKVPDDSFADRLSRFGG